MAGSKGKYGSFRFWKNICVAGKTDALLTCAIRQHLRDEQIIVKRHTSKAYFTLVCVYHCDIKLRLTNSCDLNKKQVVKVIWHKPASPPQTYGSIVFARWCPPMRAYWHHLANTTELVVPLVHPESTTKTGKWISWAISAQLMAKSPYTLWWAPLSPKIAHSHEGIWTPSNLWFRGPVKEPLLQGSLVWQTDRPHATWSVTIGRI